MPTALKDHVDKVLESMREHPQMWGGNEAIECQALSLMCAEHYLLIGDESRNVPEAYQRELRLKYGTGVFPLCVRIADPKEFAERLYEVCLKIRTELNLT